MVIRHLYSLIVFICNRIVFMIIKDCWLKSGASGTDAARQANERYKKGAALEINIGCFHSAGEDSFAKSWGSTMGCIVQQLSCSALHFVC